MGNFILTKSNLANSCEHEDSEVLYPLTNSEQVIVGDDTSLATWIESLDIPSATTIPFHYNTGIKTATINNVDLYTPYLRTVDSVIFNGIPKFDWNYFKLGTQDHNDEIQFDLSFVSNYINNTLSVGRIKNIGDNTLTDITIPKTFLNISYDDINERIQFDLSTGNFEDHAYISKNLIASMSTSKTYTLSNGDDNTIVLSDGDTKTTATYQTYTVSNGLTLEGDDIQHTNNITAGEVSASITVDGKLNIPTVSYDSNGHITGKTNNELTIPEKIDTTSLWLSNGLVTNYFRIPNNWVSEAYRTDSENFKFYYVPLFKIVPKTGAGVSYRANTLFEVVSRMDFNYYGKYSLAYSTPSSIYSQSLLQITTAPSVSGDTTRLNLEAYIRQEEINGVSSLVITVYRKIVTPNNDVKSGITADTFFVSILGYNNPNLTVPQNEHIFYSINGETGDVRPDSILEITYENQNILGDRIPLVY